VFSGTNVANCTGDLEKLYVDNKPGRVAEWGLISHLSHNKSFLENNLSSLSIAMVLWWYSVLRLEQYKENQHGSNTWITNSIEKWLTTAQ